MIIVAAKVKVKPGRRDDFIRAAQTTIAATRREAGCLHYTLYASTEDENALMYYEQWTGRDALDAHIKSAHMAAWAALKKELDLVEGPTDAKVFDVKE